MKLKFKHAILCLLATMLCFCMACNDTIEEPTVTYSTDAVSTPSDTEISVEGQETTIPEQTQDSIAESTEQSMEEQTPTQLISSDCIDIPTPYVVLKYPAQWQEYLRTEINDGENVSVNFYCSFENQTECLLFTVLFDVPYENAIGLIGTEQGSVSIGVFVCDFAPDASWSDFHINVARSMLDDVNVLIRELSAEVMEFESSSMTIHTPYVDLDYPLLWQDYLVIHQEEGEPYAVHFIASLPNREEIALFDLYFGDGQGDCIGYIQADGKKVAVNYCPFEIRISEDWAEEEINTLYGMQDCINEIIDGLLATGKFSYPEF